MVTIFGKPTMHQELCIHCSVRSSLCLGKVGHNCPILQFLEGPPECCGLVTGTQLTADTLDDPPVALGLVPVTRREPEVCGSCKDLVLISCFYQLTRHMLCGPLPFDHQHRTKNKSPCVPCSSPFSFSFSSGLSGGIKKPPAFAYVNLVPK